MGRLAQRVKASMGRYRLVWLVILAGLILLLAEIICFSDGDQYPVHRHIEEISERVEVIYGRQALAVLPFIDGSGLFKAEIALNIPNGQSALNAQAADVVARSDEVDYGKAFRTHIGTSLKSDIRE